MSKFEIPETLDGLSVDALLDLRTKAQKALPALSDDASNEDIEKAEAIVEFITMTDTRITEVRTEETAKAERIAKVKAAAEAKVEEPADEEAPVDEAKEPDSEALPADGEVPTDEVVDESKVEDKEPEAVAASAKKQSAVARAAANATPPEAPVNKRTISITAAADINGISAGADLEDLDAVTAAATKRLSAFPKGRIGGKSGTQIKAGIATFNLGAARTDGLVVGNPDFKNDYDLLKEAGRESRLEGGSLVAAGGWFAPADTLYDFCREVSTDGILDLPSVAAPRGSIRYTRGPDFAAIYANANGDWLLTEAQVIADTVKPMIEVETPTWQDVTLDVTGVAVSAGILTNSAYPELVREYIENVIIAHQHKVAGRLYASMLVASTTAVDLSTATNQVDALGQLEMAANYYRQVKRMSMNTTIEAPLPFWMLGVFRADLARRTGVDLSNVQDAQVVAHIKTRGINPQWLYNTAMDITLVANADVPSTDNVVIPATITFPFYKAGTFVKLTNDLITLEGVYDSTNIKTNTFTALFTEEAYALANLCGDSFAVTMATGATGLSGAADQTASVIQLAV